MFRLHPAVDRPAHASEHRTDHRTVNWRVDEVDQEMRYGHRREKGEEQAETGAVEQVRE
jgi:hypothetical protein